MEVFTLVFGKKSSFFLYSWCICQTQKFYHAWEKISNICEAIHSGLKMEKYSSIKAQTKFIDSSLGASRNGTFFYKFYPTVK